MLLSSCINLWFVIVLIVLVCESICDGEYQNGTRYYKTYSKFLKIHKARRYCEKRNYTLLIEEDIDEHNEIVNNFGAMDIEDYWVDISSDGNLRNGTKAPFVIWDSGEPQHTSDWKCVLSNVRNKHKKYSSTTCAYISSIICKKYVPPLLKYYEHELLSHGKSATCSAKPSDAKELTDGNLETCKNVADIRGLNWFRIDLGVIDRLDKVEITLGRYGYTSVETKIEYSLDGLFYYLCNSFHYHSISNQIMLLECKGYGRYIRINQKERRRCPKDTESYCALEICEVKVFGVKFQAEKKARDDAIKARKEYERRREIALLQDFVNTHPQ